MAELFSEIKIKEFKIKNRVVLPPMVNFGWSDDKGFVSEKHVQHYDRISRNEAGIIIVEATCISRDGRVADSQLGIWSDEHVEGLKKITSACHKHGAVVLIQIHHSGLVVKEIISEFAYGPSAIEGNPRTRELTIEQMEKIKQNFIDAAIRAKNAMFDGIELHGAHGFLLNQFTNEKINKRTDAYGGTFSGRMRYPTEIITGIKNAVEEPFILGYRLGVNHSSIEEGIDAAKYLEKNGIDILHVSHGGNKDEINAKPAGFDYNNVVYNGTIVKKNVNVPVITVNEIQTPKRASWLIENNLSDFVSIGRDLLVDNKWVIKAGTGEEINYCAHCKTGCKRHAAPENCPYYEYEYDE
ncbi:MAG: NADH:flavin oxidoreductase [Ignavibacteria bacterium]|nr:NADH:flavin oxidoreductase [Ignavibacteria bacterium]